MSRNGLGLYFKCQSGNRHCFVVKSEEVFREPNTATYLGVNYLIKLGGSKNLEEKKMWRYFRIKILIKKKKDKPLVQGYKKIHLVNHRDEGRDLLTMTSQYVIAMQRVLYQRYWQVVLMSFVFSPKLTDCRTKTLIILLWRGAFQVIFGTISIKAQFILHRSEKQIKLWPWNGTWPESHDVIVLYGGDDLKGLSR